MILHAAGESKIKVQSELCDLEQVILKPQFQADHCLTNWRQIRYHSLLWGDGIRKGTDLEKKVYLLGIHPAELGKLTFTFFFFEIQI